MTTLELYRKHKKGEIGRDRFLYEVRRDNNLPWVTNTTSYDDAVKILKNKGIISEAQFEPQNIPTDPLVDRVNPYALKREVEKLLAKEPELTNDSYKEALNKAAKKLAGNPQAVKNAMFANAESVEKADAKLQTQEVKKNNLNDKHNGMKKTKGQSMPKVTAAPTKENKKAKKPKGVEVMKEKGVEGSEKIIKEISSYLKKKLTENSSYHDYHLGQKVDTQYGPAVITAIDGGTLTVQTEDDKLYDVQMNHAKHFTDKKKEEGDASMEADEKAVHVDEARTSDIKTGKKYHWGGKKVEIVSVDGSVIKARQVGDSQVFILRDPQNLKPITEDRDEVKTDSTITVTVGDAARAIELFRDSPFKQYLNTGEIEMDGTNAYIIKDLEVAEGLLNLFQENGIELIDYELSKEDEEDLDEARRDINDPALVSARARIATPKKSLDDYLDDRDRDFEILQQIKALKREKFQVMRDMEQEAEPEGGPIADDYADRLMDLDKQIKSLESRLYEEEDLEELVKINPKTKKMGFAPSKADEPVLNRLGFTQTVPGSDNITIAS